MGVIVMDRVTVSEDFEEKLMLGRTPGSCMGIWNPHLNNTEENNEYLIQNTVKL